MKQRSMGRIFTILTTFAVATLLTVTANETRASQGQPFFNPLAGLSNALQKRCEDAWYQSSASETCSLNYGGISFVPSDWNRCELKNVRCLLANSADYSFAFPNNWNGTIEDLKGLSNCFGLLRQGSC